MTFSKKCVKKFHMFLSIDIEDSILSGGKGVMGLSRKKLDYEKWRNNRNKL